MLRDRATTYVIQFWRGLVKRPKRAGESPGLTTRRSYAWGEKIINKIRRRRRPRAAAETMSRTRASMLLLDRLAPSIATPEERERLLDEIERAARDSDWAPIRLPESEDMRSMLLAGFGVPPAALGRCPTHDEPLVNCRCIAVPIHEADDMQRMREREAHDRATEAAHQAFVAFRDLSRAFRDGAHQMSTFATGLRELVLGAEESGLVLTVGRNRTRYQYELSVMIPDRYIHGEGRPDSRYVEEPLRRDQAPVTDGLPAGPDEMIPATWAALGGRPTTE
jgi:hypothetical protein